MKATLISERSRPYLVEMYGIAAALVEDMLPFGMVLVTGRHPKDYDLLKPAQFDEEYMHIGTLSDVFIPVEYAFKTKKLGDPK